MCRGCLGGVEEVLEGIMGIWGIFCVRNGSG